jgi:hypothetical protein
VQLERRTTDGVRGVPLDKSRSTALEQAEHNLRYLIGRRTLGPTLEEKRDSSFDTMDADGILV